ncbi:cationic amino acid transporter 4-like isoform X4 [Choloepus didactylus]|uniref:cationic amino acid transporter 4-like isoform X4 n=1 Tax=Choloepus didactylus TaxID=27675 RepID=UPI00189FCA89|nr:cationic amino acid transporter 4-like isoform X4 [Choloepus didactylus]
MQRYCVRQEAASLKGKQGADSDGRWTAGEEGARALASAVTPHPSIKRLTLRDNGLRAVGALAAALSTSSCLCGWHAGSTPWEVELLLFWILESCLSSQEAPVFHSAPRSQPRRSSQLLHPEGLPSTTGLAYFCQKLNRVKPLEESTAETSSHHHMSLLDLTLLSMGSIGGLSLFTLTGAIAKELAGPAITVSITLGTMASLLASLSYAEFGARVPHKASAYLLTYVSMGELWAFLVGWDMLRMYLIGSATAAWAWSSYLDAMFSHHISNFFKTYLGVWQVPFLAPYPEFLAATILLLSSVFVSCGVRVSSWVHCTFRAISLGIILFTTVLGFILARPQNWSSQEGGFAPFGFSGIVGGTTTFFYAFIDFEIIATTSEEARNPRQAMPKAIVIRLFLAATAYILVSMALTLMVPWHSLDPYTALADAFFQRGYSWAGVIVAAVSICAMTIILLCNLYIVPLFINAMAVDGLFFQLFAPVRPHTQIPMVVIWVYGILTATLAMLLDSEALVQLLSIGMLLPYTFMAASVIVLRFRKSSPPRSPGLASYSPGTEVPAHSVAPEPGRLRPALRPYLGFLDRCGHGTAVAWALGLLVASAVTLGCVLNFGDSVLHLPRWGYILLLLSSGVVFLLSLAVLGAHQQQHRQDIFQVPLVPLTPALSILLNICFMLQLSLLSWVCLLIWLIIGLCVYFGYGIRHSKLNLQEALCGDSQVEMGQAVQPLSQSPAQEPGQMEQPTEL